MAVELASAFVSIIPTTKGIQGNLERELAPLAGAASKAGAESGKALGSSFSGASGGLSSAVGNAEGAIMSMKGKAIGAFESMGISAGMLKIAGAGALIEFGIKGVEAFEHTALAARNLGTATGLSVEEASRWIGVAKDMGLNSDNLTASLGKVGKTLDSQKWKDFGIETRDAGGQARGTNEILLETFDKLGRISNETERATQGNKLFGKGYASLSPLIGKSREELEHYLGTVEKGQVITEGELATAEKMHHAQEALKQAFGELTLAVGQTVASWAPLLELAAKIIAAIPGTAAQQQAQETFGELAKLHGEMEKGGHTMDFWVQKSGEMNWSLEQTKEAIHESTLSHDELKISQKEQAAQTAETARETSRLPIAWEETRDAATEAAAAELLYKANAENTKRAVVQNLAEISTAWDVLTGNVDADKTWLTLQGQFDDLKQAAVDSFTATKTHADDAVAKAREYELKIDDIKLAVRQYSADVMGVPTGWATIFKSEIDRGSFDLVENQLAILTRNRTMALSIELKGGAGVFQIIGKPAASGGWRQGPTLVGENGPEIVDFKRPGFVHTAADTKEIMASNSSLMNMTNRADGTQRAGLHIEHIDVHNDTDADGFFRYANFLLAG